MKRFIKRLLVFSSPLFLLVICFFLYAELTLYYYPSIFEKKTTHFLHQRDNIDILVLGSSHNQCAINPEHLQDYNVSNLAFSGQNIKIDAEILSKYIDQMPQLKIVVFEISYHTLEHAYDPEYHRNSLYLRFHNLNLFDRKIRPLDYSIYLSKPKLYNKFLKPWVRKTPINKYGFTIENSKILRKKTRFERLNFDFDAIMRDTINTIENRHQYEDLKAYDSNSLILNELFELCLNKEVVPVIIIPPVFKKYYESYIPQKKERRKHFLDDLRKTYPNFSVLDYEQVSYFEITDFLDEDHLNTKGAEKLSHILTDEFGQILQE